MTPFHAIEQALDYSLDLKNFHEQSHQRRIIPVVVATEAPAIKNKIVVYDDLVSFPLKANKENLLAVLIEVVSVSNEHPIDPVTWETSIYKPTPTIIEAAQALYRGHSVQEISRADSGAINLSKTSDAINKIIDQAKAENKKSICFITGVPGAGKTLAGLNIANKRHKFDEGEHAVFLSGNGPLVQVLQEALARNEVKDSRDSQTRVTKKAALSKTKAFIQNIHHFRDDAIRTKESPIEGVVIFDEAMRLWPKIQKDYPICLTRNISTAKRWLRHKARGSERIGITASSGAYRLRPFGIHVKNSIDPKHWFLDSKDDIRSSYFLEEAATEFDIQGLELDWTCVAWDANFRINNGGWEYKNFRGTKWQNVNASTRRQYLKNAYRVLLTRARQGMILFIPEGDNDDSTRLCEFYDPTFNYFTEIGFPII